LLLLTEKQHRAIGGVLVGVSAAALAATLFVAIPHFRLAYHLQGSSQFLEGRYGVDGPSTLVPILGRALSGRSLARLGTILSSTAFLALAAPGWAAIALPGLVLNLVAIPGTPQAGVIGHYLWPILPWFFIAAIVGASRLPTWTRRFAPAVIVLVACADTPILAALMPGRWHTPDAAIALERQLAAIPPSAAITAQPNLVPHLPRRSGIRTLGPYEPAVLDSSFILLTHVGDQWPFSSAQIDERAGLLRRDPRYVMTVEGPLLAFRMVESPGARVPNDEASHQSASRESPVNGDIPSDPSSITLKF
jgi:hypothetical protein